MEMNEQAVEDARINAKLNGLIISIKGPVIL